MQVPSESELPAESLLGKKLGKWQVTEKITQAANATGGCFSVQYKVRDELTGDKAFLKAIDLFRDPKALEKMETGIRNYRYEADILQLCHSKAMDGIVRALDSGIHIEIAGPVQLPVPYLVFEEAEADVRTHKDAFTFNLGWRLRIFHGVCVAMRQLHAERIAHQDLKPSNILVFPESKAKVADLGRATMQGNPSFFEESGHVGDWNYVPPELLYKEYRSDNWLLRRLGADFFMMGCVLTFLITDSSLLTLVFERLNKSFWPNSWGGTYESVTPHLTDSIHQVLVEIKPTLPDGFRDELCAIICQFVAADPTKRGKPHKWTGQLGSERFEPTLEQVEEQYNLERIISRIDFFAKQAVRDRCTVKNSFSKQRFLDFFLGR